MSYFSQIKVADSATNDAFNRLRVSDPTAIFSVQSQYNTNPLVMETGNTGTGVAPAHSANTRLVALSCTAGTGTSFTQSYQYIPYQPGKSQLMKYTGVLGAAVTGTVTEIGSFDTDNGILFRQASDGTLSFVRRTKTSGSVVEEVVPQSSWSVDKMNGTGISGHTFNVLNSFILVFDAQYLGMGRIRCGFNWNGITYIAHEFMNANNMTVPYMQTLTLPVQMLVTSTSSGSTKTAWFKCAAIESEGGLSETVGLPFSTPVVTATAGNGSYVHLLSIRPKTTFNSITNRTYFVFDDLNLYVSGANPVDVIITVGATFSVAPTFADVDTNSSYEYGTGGTVSTTGNILYTTFNPSGSGGSANQTTNNIHLGITNPITLNRAGVVRAGGTLSVFVSGIGGTSATRGSINYKEIR